MRYYKHKTAVVDKGAEIGIETSIWHFCHISPCCVIGNHCSLGQNVFVDNGAAVGNFCRIQNNVNIYRG
jgi:UDP-2-acetamido-3-amino-2,3-dideoxy-glucuronate N-acetyltransferase